METKRAPRSVRFLSYCTASIGRALRSLAVPVVALAESGAKEGRRRADDGFSTIFVTAALSVIALIAVAGFEIQQVIGGRNVATTYVAAAPAQSQTADGSPLSQTATTITQTSAATSSDGSTALGSEILGTLVSKYVGLQQQGLYTPEVGQSVAEKMATTLKAPIVYTTYTPADLQTVADTSYDRMLAYRSDLQTSLAPLMKNTQLEFEIFAYYVQTKDTKYLDQLKMVAQNYRDAAVATAKVTVPNDATTYHVAILNAMQEFAATLDQMAANADDPFASVALLKSYNQAESDTLMSFNALLTYYKSKKP